ncbi:MAG: S46 family peptidase, partial [candidate division Zixibacteria bacterium]|nr:S46 family peptidase [candidate division Zixibacteria bacterium]
MEVIMRRFAPVVLALILALTLAAPASHADEGMWPLFDLESLDFDEYKARGLELEPNEIFNEQDGGLAAAVVQVGGGTGSFVSPNGLILTNHHVAFSGLQKASRVDDYVLRSGFHATSIEEEVPALGYNAYITKSFENVTDEIKSVLTDDMTDIERHDALEAKEKELVAAAEADGADRASVRGFHSGVEYYLVRYKRIRDVRIVYAPPLSIGEYGGDVDNWMWPRHTGDFSFLRAYVGPDGSDAEYSEDNVPFTPKHYLPFSTAPLSEGTFALVMGYPGRTTRYRSSFEIDDLVNEYYPEMLTTLTDVLDIMQNVSDADIEAEIKLASTMNGLNNALKNARGKYDGLRKAKLVDRKVQEEAELMGFINADPQREAQYGTVLDDLKTEQDKADRWQDKDRTMKWMSWIVDYVGLASRLHRWSIEKTKPDMEREPGYMDRNFDRLKRSMEQANYTLEPVSDRQVFEYFLWKALRLPEDQRLASVDSYFPIEPGADTAAAVNAFLDRFYGNTILSDTEQRLAMLDMSTAELLATGDPFIEFAQATYEERSEIEDRSDAHSGALEKLRPRLVEAIVAMRGSDAYPDANGTIRFQPGEVKSYEPRDGVKYNWYTTLSGVVEKETGEEPFENPEPLLTAYKSQDFGPYYDETIGDVPGNILTDNDGTGGNSGSPVMNGKGEIIGVEFDGNWEGIIGDFAWN